jgi:hypothetical protein
MPWDSTCNKDHDDVVLRHVAATYGLDFHDPRKFKLGTPKDVSSAYRRIYNNPVVLRDGKPIIPLGEGAPPAYRLGHDIMKVPTYWKRVFDNEGLNVQTNILGHRGDELRQATKDKKVKSKHGGRREKKKSLDSWFHPDAKAAMDIFFKKEEKKYEVVLLAVQDKHGVMSLPPQPAMDPDTVEMIEDSELPANLPGNGLDDDDDDGIDDLYC